MPQDILITPNKNSSTTQGKIDFTGKGASATPITLKVLDDSTLSFENTAGQLFSITPVLASGTIFSVNDVSGIPMIDVDASGLVRLAPLGGTVYSNTLYGVTKTVAGAGNSVTIRAADGVTSGAGGSVVLQPGLQATTGGDGLVVVRQPNGVAGTDEIQLSHDGSKGSVINKDGALQVGGNNIALRNAANNGTTTITGSQYYATQINSNDGVNADGVCNTSFNWGIDSSSLNWNQNFHIRVSWAHIYTYGGAGIAYTGSNSNGRYSTLEITDGGSNGGSLAYRSTDHSITANTNDLTPARYSAFQRWSSTGNFNVTGLAPGASTSFGGGTPTWVHTNGRVIWVYNVGSNRITLKHEDAGSTAANRFLTETGGDIVVGPGRYAQLIYDTTSSRWRVTGENFPYIFPTTDGTSGQVLSTNGSGTLSWTTSSGGLSGTGTANSLTKFTSGTAVGNSIIVEDSSSTTATLIATSNTAYDTLALRNTSVSGYSSMRLIDSAGTSRFAFGWGNASSGLPGAYIYGYTTDDFRIFTNTSERLRVTSGGLVGINAASPGAQLQINPSASGTKGMIVRGAASQTANFLELQNSSGTNLVAVDSTGELILGSGVPAVPSVTTAKLWIAAGTQNPGAVSAAGTTAMMVAGGNIFVCGDGTLSDQAAVIFRGADGAGSKARFLFVGDSSVKNSSITSIVDTQGQSGHLAFDTAPSAASGLQERMRITSAGNVGIGTTSPSDKLHVIGNIRAGDYTYGYLGMTGDLPGYSNGSYPTLKSPQTIYFSADGKYSAYLGDSNKNAFGLMHPTTGTNTILFLPNGTSFFNGGAVAFGATTAAGGGQVYITPQASGTKGLVVRGAASQSANLTEWQTSAGQVNAFFAPDGKLSVLQNTQTQQGGVEESVASFGHKSFWSNADAGLISVGFTDIAGTYNSSSARWDMYFKTGNSGDPSARTERMRILGSNGNVGIGTKVPDKLLTIAGNAATPQITIYKSPDGSINSAQQIAVLGTGSSNSNSGTTGGNEYGLLQLMHNGTIRCQIYAGGNGWILDGMSFGTNSSPGAQVLVVPSAAATKGLIVRGAASQSANLQEWQNNGGTALAAVDANGNISGAGISGSSLSGSSTTYGGSLLTDYWRVKSFYRAAPTTVGNYIEICNINEGCGIYEIEATSEFGAGIGTTSKKYIVCTAFGVWTGHTLTPIDYMRQSGYTSSFDFELELHRVAAYDVRLRLRRTAGTSARYVTITVKQQYLNASDITSLSGTGTSPYGGFGQGFSIGPANYALPVIGGSGAGNNIGFYAGNGETSGAGGSIILQPGAQATTGGNGSIRFINPSNTAQYFTIAPSTSALDFSLTGISNDVNTGGINFNGINIRGLGTVNTAALFAGSFYAQGSTLRATNGTSVQLGSSNGTSTDNINYIWMRQDGHIAWYGDIGLRRDGVGVLSVTNGSTGGGSLAYKSNTTNISTATNNLVLNGSAFQRLNCTAACNLTGIAPPSGSHIDGRMMRIYNVGTANLTLKHNSTSSDVANRFCCVQAVDIILAPRDYAELIYDGTDGGLVGGQNNPCWRVH